MIRGLQAMPVCSFCQKKGFSSCEASPSDSSRCIQCVSAKRGLCDMVGLSPVQLRHVATQHNNLEDELEEAEAAALQAQAKVLRLRKQKKLWFEKMMRAVSRGIDNVEELEKVEREEAERAEQARLAGRPPSSEGRADAQFMDDWNKLYSHVELDPSLYSTFGILPESSGSAERASSGSPGVH